MDTYLYRYAAMCVLRYLQKKKNMCRAMYDTSRWVSELYKYEGNFKKLKNQSSRTRNSKFRGGES